MKIRRLIEMLETAASENPELSVELSRVMAAKQPEAFELRLDFPICGIAIKGNDCLLVIEATPEMIAFGTPRLMNPPKVKS
jgi:hypothetical protein